jgi:hypothetical protein
MSDEEKRAYEIDIYSNELDSYLLACQCMLGLEIESVEATIANAQIDSYTKQAVSKAVIIEASLRDNFKV